MSFCCWDAVLGNAAWKVPTLHLWCAVRKSFHLGFAFRTRISHAPGTEEWPLFGGVGPLGERSQRQPKRDGCFHCSSPVDHPGLLQNLDFNSLFTMYQSMAKKEIIFFLQFFDGWVFFLKCWCMRRNQHTKIVCNVSEKSQSKIKTWPWPNSSCLGPLPLCMTNVSPKSQHQLYFSGVELDAQLSLKQNLGSHLLPGAWRHYLMHRRDSGAKGAGLKPFGYDWFWKSNVDFLVYLMYHR